MALEVDGSWVALVAMKQMQHAVQNRGQNDSRGHDEHQSRVQRVAAREQLARRGYRIAHRPRSEEHTSELQSQSNLVCRLLLEKKKPQNDIVPPADDLSTLRLA